MHHHEIKERVRIALVLLMIVLVQEFDNLWHKEVSLLLTDVVNSLLVLILKFFLILKQLRRQTTNVNDD